MTQALLTFQLERVSKLKFMLEQDLGKGESSFSIVWIIGIWRLRLPQEQSISTLDWTHPQRSRALPLEGVKWWWNCFNSDPTTDVNFHMATYYNIVVQAESSADALINLSLNQQRTADFVSNNHDFTYMLTRAGYDKTLLFKKF